MNPPIVDIQSQFPIRILLADDDADDCYFFEKVLKTIPFNTSFTTVDNGEILMTWLFQNYENLPHVIFLDQNMPRKKGTECLKEIKNAEKLKHIPVIIYSTYLQDDVADYLYENGAHYYFRKTELHNLYSFLNLVIAKLVQKDFNQPERASFTHSLDAI